jgi:hypothetical protein
MTSLGFTAFGMPQSQKAGREFEQKVAKEAKI